jgi:4-amino-4-deoxy-L-arabinose transferase-like glycosyltransferase
VNPEQASALSPPGLWPRAWFRAGRPELALGLVIAFFALATVAWVEIDTVPPHWDEAHYLYEGELLYHTLRQSGPVAFVSAFSRAIGTKAPLITVLPFPLYALMGESFLSARYVNVVFVIVASWYLYRLGEMMVGRRAALLSVILLNTFPLVAGMSRQFLVEYGLMTLVILWMYYLVRWQRGEKGWPSWALGIVLGLGMLMKVTFPLYVAVPTALVLTQDVLRHRKLRFNTLASLARIAVAALPIAGLWYFRNWATIFGFILNAGYGEAAQAYGQGSVFSLRTVGAYWLSLINFGFGAYSLLLLVVVACWVGLRVRRNENRSRIARDHLYLLLGWWIVPWLALTFAVTKEIRFTMPYLPALALLLSSGLVGLGGRRLAVLGGVAAAGILNYAYYSFGPPQPARAELRAGGLILLSKNLEWAHPPSPERWPNASVVQTIAADVAKRGIAQPKVTVMFSHFRLSAHNLNYFSALYETPVRFNTNHFQSQEPASELAGRVKTQADYLLTKSGSPGSNLLNAKNVEVLNLLREGGMPFDSLGVIPLPDGSEVTILRRQERGYRQWKPEDYAREHELSPQARFGGGIALLDSAVAVEPGGARITLVWQCKAAMQEDYRVFVHVIDPGGTPYANADHYPASGRSQTSHWRVGDVLEEEIWIPQVLPAGYRVFVGWYHLGRRFQLPLEGKEAAWAGEPNAVQIY